MGLYRNLHDQTSCWCTIVRLCVVSGAPAQVCKMQATGGSNKRGTFSSPEAMNPLLFLSGNCALMQSSMGLTTPPPHGLDPVFLALSRLRRRKFDACIEMCTHLLDRNPMDQVTSQQQTTLGRKCTMLQQIWYIKAKALTEKEWIDDTELEEEGVAELLMDDNAIAAVPRYFSHHSLSEHI